MLMGEERQHLAVYEPLLKQIGEHAAHVVIGVGQGEFLLGRRRAFFDLIPFHACFAAEQERHRFGEAHAVEFLHKINGEAAFLTGMPVPSVSPDRHAVMPLPAPLASGARELLALPLEEVHQVDGVGASFLLIGKWDECHGDTSFVSVCVCRTCGKKPPAGERTAWTVSVRVGWGRFLFSV